MKVLFIGATGVIGSQVIPLLADEIELSLAAFGGGSVAGHEVAHLDLTDWETTLHALEGQDYDAVVNCAIASHQDVDRSHPESMHHYYERCIDVNVRGAYHLFEAAARCQIERCVYISSLTTMMGPPLYQYVEHGMPPRPKDLYSVSKLFGEQLGETYAHRAHNPLNVLCLRLGQPYPSFTEIDEEWQQNDAACAFMVYVEDVASAINCALRTGIRFGVYPILSQADASWIDTSCCEEIGYQPRWHFSPQGLQQSLSKL